MSEDLYRKGVSALVINQQEELLLVNLESFEENYFAIPGGGVEAGEVLEAAIYRELSEELGISHHALTLIGASDVPVRIKFQQIKLFRDGVSYTGQERYFFGFRFTGSTSDLSPRKGEVRSFCWAALANLHNYLLFENQLEETLAKYREIFG